jgi:hypothetical protein
MIPPDDLGAFDHFVQGKSGEILPGLFGEIVTAR